MRISEFPYLTRIVWLILAIAIVLGVLSGHWTNVFVSVTAMLLTVLPVMFSHRFRIVLPASFLMAITLFAFGTLFLGEVFGFYQRFWWWDVVLHGSSAILFGMVGFLFVFYLFEGDKYAAPPWALSLFAFSFALSIGALWEVFEFGMDQLFGLNMQKSGLVDTMSDIAVDAVGAFTGVISGFFWLKGRQEGPAGMIEEFIRLNRSAFRKLKKKAGGRWPPGARGKD